MCRWASLEYGCATCKGQSLGGRWKPLHHLLRSCLYTLVTAAVTNRGQLYVRNDGKEALQGVVTVSLIDFATGEEHGAFVGEVRLAAGGTIWWANVGALMCPSGRSGSCCVSTSLRGASALLPIQNVQLLALPKDLELPLASVLSSHLVR
jgi:hypothetical protein